MYGLGHSVTTPCHWNTAQSPEPRLIPFAPYRLLGMSPASTQPVRRNLIAALFVAFGIAPGALHCATLQQLSLDDMIVRSNSIVRGKVASSWAALTGSIIYTHYRIQVSESFKGPKQSVVEIMVPGGAVDNLQQNFSGSPALNTGDELVFFLWTSKAGITWVTGLTQGLFALPPNVANAGTPVDRMAADHKASDPIAPDPMATRAPSRELMLDPSTARPVRDSALSMRLSELRGRIARTLAAGTGAAAKGEAQ